MGISVFLPVAMIKQIRGERLCSGSQLLATVYYCRKSHKEVLRPAGHITLIVKNQRARNACMRALSLLSPL